MSSSADDSNVVFLNGLGVTIRAALEGDAPELVRHFNACGGESTFLSFGSGEYYRTEVEEAERIQASSAENNHLYLTAWVGGALVATLAVWAPTRARLRHVGEFGVAVRKEFWGHGLGPELLRRMLDWARSGALQKVSLKVRSDNTRAIEMYQQLGFVVEGTLRNEIKLNDGYRDVLLMSILFPSTT